MENHQPTDFERLVCACVDDIAELLRGRGLTPEDAFVVLISAYATFALHLPPYQRIVAIERLIERAGEMEGILETAEAQIAVNRKKDDE